MMIDNSRVAVLIACYNEEAAIAKVVSDFRAALPEASIYVYDNNSTDNTKQVALDHGAIVRDEPMQGKGNVIRRMFADIDASVYVMVDGDDTYDAASAQAMVDKLMENHVDMVIGNRVEQDKAAYRLGHRTGNRLLTFIVRLLFGDQSYDLLSGYRVMSRRFVKSFTAISTGFETETELTIHALSLKIPIDTVQTPYSERPEDSHSKLNTYRDGARILSTIALFTKEERPFLFFGIIFAVLASLSLLLGLPVAIEFLETGLVPRFPTAILSASIMLLAFLSFTTGLVLDSVARGRREQKRLRYLSLDWL